ncbi:hypothetical protein QDR37_15085 [Amnibacterium sp. CER49]|uniref:pilus assembly protein TadG-related protein n=1 Tax=Amnibacterium sp. CER49 TaxID=3039161 RepID=UPI002449105F|nr:pilus assembly protein TadG-related protein [Amnibacterium sp. CER49]MDH2445275.1 hypothetical protein [Amnibacterium sp. CER49]
MLEGDEGSTLPLLLVFVVIAAGFVVTAAAATSLHLERLRLLTLADGAALAAAESFAVADAHVESGVVVPRLTAPAVAAEARAYLADADAAGFDGLTLDSATTPDGRTASVRLTAVWHPPVAGALLPLSVPVTVTSTAAARFG